MEFASILTNAQLVEDANQNKNIILYLPFKIIVAPVRIAVIKHHPVTA